MEDYIKKYPKEEKNVYALVYAFGIDVAEKICNEALVLNKKIILIIDHKKLDYLDYKLV
jgi:hypothetical protein